MGLGDPAGQHRLTATRDRRARPRGCGHDRDEAGGRVRQHPARDVDRHHDGVARLDRPGSLSRRADAGDGWRKLVRLTERGGDCLTRSAEILDALHDEWVDRLGADRLRALEEDPRMLAPGHPLWVDVPGWFGTAG
ncbi:hypothetical protein BH20ACT5_BH20ACT5_21030 [soil metagenome]